MTQADITTSVATGDAVMQQLEDAGLGPIHWMNAAWVDALTEMNTHLVEFVTTRLSEDLKTQQDMLRCDTIESFQSAQLRYLTTAKDQYIAETCKRMQLAMRIWTPPRCSKATPV